MEINNDHVIPLMVDNSHVIPMMVEDVTKKPPSEDSYTRIGSVADLMGELQIWDEEQSRKNIPDITSTAWAWPKSPPGFLNGIADVPDDEGNTIGPDVEIPNERKWVESESGLTVTYNEAGSISQVCFIEDAIMAVQSARLVNSANFTEVKENEDTIARSIPYRHSMELLTPSSMSPHWKGNPARYSVLIWRT